MPGTHGAPPLAVDRNPDLNSLTPQWEFRGVPVCFCLLSRTSAVALRRAPPGRPCWPQMPGTTAAATVPGTPTPARVQLTGTGTADLRT